MIDTFYHFDSGATRSGCQNDRKQACSKQRTLHFARKCQKCQLCQCKFLLLHKNDPLLVAALVNETDVPAELHLAYKRRPAVIVRVAEPVAATSVPDPFAAVFQPAKV